MAAQALRPLILICDDELPLRELIKAVLGDRYEYVEAEDADQAEAVLARHEPEAIVLDVMLPGRSGIEFLAELHHLRAQLERGRADLGGTRAVGVRRLESRVGCEEEAERRADRGGADRRRGDHAPDDATQR
jgi:CheY-like chemotaxis protein